jgi:hypothetical protein
MHHPCDPIPEHITNHVNHMRWGRDSPGPSPDKVRPDRDLYDLSMDVMASNAEKYFYAHISPKPKSSNSVKRTERQPIARYAVQSIGSMEA